MSTDKDIRTLFGQFRPSPFAPGSDPTTVPQEMPTGAGQIQPVGFLQDGVVTTTTLGSGVAGSTLDKIAPAMPQGFAVLPGYKGFAASWSPAMVQDMLFSEVRYAIDDGTGTAPDTGQWTIVRAKTSTIFVSNLVPTQLYWVQVRAVDMTGNVETSLTDSTAVNYLTYPEAGWTTAMSVTPTLIGAADIAANSITAAMIQTGALDADDIAAGTLHISPLAAYAVGIEILNASAVAIGRWDETGLKIADASDTSRYVLIDAGQLKFTIDGGVTFSTAVTPDGINASSVNFGSLPGGHNVMLNSSFELTAFIAVPTTAVFTDTAGTPGWKAGNRVTSPSNVTEGTELTETTLTF